MTYRVVVVGTDGSETASKAVRHAGAIAASSGARVVVVTAFTPDPHRESERTARAPDDLKWTLTDRAEADQIAESGRALLREAGVNDVVLRSEAGGPADSILSATKEFDADLIVVGSVGMTSSARFLLGSVANDVAHHAPCDVLIVDTDADHPR